MESAEEYSLTFFPEAEKGEFKINELVLLIGPVINFSRGTIL
jgi:hypothetical protein